MYSQSCCDKKVMICSQTIEETDVFENCYTFPCGSLNELWFAEGIVNPCGSFVLTAEQTCDGVEVFINGETTPIATLLAGQSIIITSDPLTRIEANCLGTGGNCRLKLCVTLHYECC